MHTHLYFAVASLNAPFALSPVQCDLAWRGEFRILERQLGGAVDAAGDRADPAVQRAYADLQLVFGRIEEAEQLHREALKRYAGDRVRYGVLSCRNAAWQALFLQRNAAALACFRRVLENTHAELGVLLEAWVGLTLVMFQLGRLGAAWECAERAEALAQQHGLARWQMLAVMLQRDLAAQQRLRGSDAVADHVYWRSLIVDIRLPPEGWRGAPCVSVEDGALSRHAAFLQHLCGLAEGNAQSVQALADHVNWVGSLAMVEYARVIRLDVSLAALAGGRSDLARQMLEAFGEPNATHARGGHWWLDYLFCQAEVPRCLGRRHESDVNYRRYYLCAMKRIREQSAAMHAPAPVPGQREPLAPGDDVSARLVGKYRRAYAYLVEHLDQPDLSVKEVAAHIGVTERALQLAMRSSLGISPTQLIRRLRMERIHQELTTDGSFKNVLAVAAKWGVRHRSTLANAYRRQFNESPSETVMRSAA